MSFHTGLGFGSGGGHGHISVASPTTLVFYDETGNNPLPPGINVTFAWTDNNGAVHFNTGNWTVAGGLVTSTLVSGTTYTATFQGTQAPTLPVSFTFFRPNPNVKFPVTVTNYRSPCLGLNPVTSSHGYADLFCELQPKGWYSTLAMAPSGVLHSLARGFMGGHTVVDNEAQLIQEQLRLQTCQNNEIDTWALDMVGPLFQRYKNESDSVYRSRIQLLIGRPRCTINAIQNIVIAFFTSVVGSNISTTGGGLALDLAGSLNVGGGLNTPPTTGSIPISSVPLIVVWDGMTQPLLAKIYGVTPIEFVIQIGQVNPSPSGYLALDVAGGLNYGGFLNYAPTGFIPPSLSSIAPDPRLALIINWLAKGGGTKPLYLVGTY